MLDFLDQRRVQALGAAIGRACHRDFGTTAGDAAGGALEAFELGDHLLHRPTGGRLDDHEVDQQNAEQGRNDEQQSPKNVRQHLITPCPQDRPAVWFRLLLPA
ncbi:hypothetical protein D3C84_964980 [compost metagenome]